MIAFGYAPMEMRAVAVLPEDAGWQFEPKWDGFRCLAFRDRADIALQSKSGQPLGRYFPEIVAALGALPFERFVFDGELVVPEEGALSFDALQQRIHPAASRVALLARRTPARYLVFDVLSIGGIDIVDRPLGERRARLDELAATLSGAEIDVSPATRERSVVDGWFASVGGALDGVVAKRLDMAYGSGTRDAAVKVKRQRTADCVVGGFRYAKNSTSQVGSLLLGLFDDAGLLDHVGFCSTFANAERVELLARLQPHIGEPGFSGNAPDGTPSRWSRGEDRDRSYVKLRPELVLEVVFDQVTNGRIRHGTRPLRWRSDKAPRQCTIDQLAVPDAGRAWPIRAGMWSA